MLTHLQDDFDNHRHGSISASATRLSTVPTGRLPHLHNQVSQLQHFRRKPTSDLSSTLLGEGIGGALFAPISESFGRRTVYLFGSVLATISCGISAIPHPASVTIGRFLTGFACAIPPSISGGIIDDIFHDSPWLTWNIYIWTTVSNAGLSVGPIVSGYLTFRVGWCVPSDFCQLVKGC